MTLEAVKISLWIYAGVKSGGYQSEGNMNNHAYILQAIQQQKKARGS